MVMIKVPATSANLGPGFDSLGLAVSLYLTVEIIEETKCWEIEHHLGKGIPQDDTNLVIQTALKLAPNLTPHKLLMKSEIPPARGLGSSSAAIVAGIELANHLGNLEMTKDDKIQFAAKIEGHPDNILPAILGDFTVGTMFGDQVVWTQSTFPETGLLITIPNRELLTTESRSVLPTSLSFSESTKGSSVANVLVSAVHQGDLVQAGFLMEQDLFHEPYRSELIPELNKIREIAHKENAYGTYLSGAGTTVLTLLPVDKISVLKERVQELYPDYTLLQTTIERMGSVLV